jgi:putative glutamine transport system substrate-binding protein
MKGLFSMCAAAVLILAAEVSAQEMPKFAPDSYMTRIQQRGTLNVGLKAELPGVGYQNPMTGKFEGFAVDLGADLAERIFGRPGKVTYKPVLGVTRIPMLEQGLVDVIIDTMFIMKERWQQVDFAEPYWGAPTRILVHKNNNAIQQLKDLEGKRLASTKGSSSERWFRDPSLNYPKVNLVLFDSIAQSIEAIRVGRADAAMFDEVFGLAAMKASSDFKFVGDPVSYDYYGMALAKGRPEYVEFVTQWLRNIKADGKWAAIYKKNLPGEVPEPPLSPFDKAYYK